MTVQDATPTPTPPASVTPTPTPTTGDDVTHPNLTLPTPETTGVHEDPARFAADVELYVREAAERTGVDAARLLHAAARLCEDRLGDGHRATTLYQQARAATGDVETRATLEALRRRAIAEGAALAAVEIVDLEAHHARSAEERADLVVEKAHLFADRLDSFDAARSALESVLAAAPRHRGALALGLTIAERSGDRTLERSFLERLLEGTAAAAPRSRLLARLAVLAEVEGRDGEAFTLATRAIEADPRGDAAALARTALLRAALRLGRDHEVAEALETDAAAATGESRRALAATCAAVLRHRLGEGDRAAALVEAALGDDPADRALLLAVADERSLGGKPDGVLEALAKVADTARDRPWAAAVNLRIAHVLDRTRRDPGAAMSRLRTALAHHAQLPGARRALERIALGANDVETLAEMAGAELDQHHAAPARAALALRAAELVEAHGGDRERALALALRAIETVAGYAPAVQMIERLLGDLGRWSELASLIESLPPTQGRRARLAALCEERLGDPGRALALLRRWQGALAPDAEDEAVVRAAERAGDALVAAEAALRLGRSAGDPDLKIPAWLFRAGVLYEERAAADREALAAFEECRAAAPDFQPALAALQRLCDRAGTLDRLPDLLGSHARAILGSGDDTKAPDAPTASRAANHFAEAARVCLDDLGRPEDALAWCQKALVLEGAEPVATDARSRALALLGRHEERAAALGASAEHLADPQIKAAHHRQQAELLEWRLRRPREALVAVERVLGALPADEWAHRTKTRLLGLLGRHADALAWEERRLTTNAGDAAEGRRMALAARLPDPERALTLLEAAPGGARPNLMALELRVALLRRFGRHSETGPSLRRLAEASPDREAAAPLWRAATWAFEAAGPEGLSQALLCAEKAVDLCAATLPDLERLARAKPDLTRLVLARKLSVDRAETAGAKAAALWDLALARAEARDGGGVTADLERALELREDFLPALRDLAKRRETEHRATEAADLCVRQSRVLTGVATAAATLEQAAQLFASAGADAAACDALERALQLEPESDRAYAVLEVLLGDQKDWERLARVIERRARTGSTAARRDRLLRLASVLEERLDRADEALAVLAQAAETDPRHGATHLRAAELLAARERAGEAVEAWRRAIAATRDPEVVRATWRRVGQVAARQLGDHTLSAAAFRSALLVDPDDADALGGLAQAAIRSRDWPEAAAALRRLAQVDARPGARVEHAKTLGDLLSGPAGDPEAALTAYEAALESDPLAIVVLDRLNALLSERGEHARLGAALDRMLAAHDRAASEEPRRGRLPSTAEANTQRLRLVALLEGPLRDPARGADVLRQAVDAAPDDVTIRLELARLLGEGAGRPAEAAMEHLEILRREPLHLGSIRALRQLFDRLGDADRASRAAAILVSLRAADPEDEHRVREARSAPLPAPRGALSDDDLATVVRHPDERHPMTALLVTLSDILPRLYPLRVEEWGVTRADRLGPRSEDPARRVVDRTAKLLGVPDGFEVYVAQSRVRDAEVDATDPPALLVAAQLVRRASAREAAMHVGRALGRLRARTHGAARLAPADLDVLLAAAMRVVFSEHGEELAPAATLEELSRRIAKAMPRRTRTGFENAVVAVAEAGPFDATRWRASLVLTSHRMALVASDDVVGLLDHVVRQERDLSSAAAGHSAEALLEAARNSAAFRDAVTFALSQDFAALRRRVAR